MFKKRSAPAVATSSSTGIPVDDDDPSSPTITVSIPQDALVEVPSTTTNRTSFDRGTGGGGGGGGSRNGSRNGSRRNSLNLVGNPNVNLNAWKPWNPTGIDLTATNTTTTGPAAASGVDPSGTTTTAGTGNKKNVTSPSMMLNLSGLFSSSSASSPGQATTQPSVQAQLWNAEVPDVSPLSPAGPRYISAVAGRGAITTGNSRLGMAKGGMSGVAGSVSMGNMTQVGSPTSSRRVPPAAGSGTTNGGSMTMGSTTGSGTWRSFGQASMPSLPAAQPSAVIMNGSRSKPAGGGSYFSRSTSSSSEVISPAPTTPSTLHHSDHQSDQRPALKSAMSFKKAAPRSSTAYIAGNAASRVEGATATRTTTTATTTHSMAHGRTGSTSTNSHPSYPQPQLVQRQGTSPNMSGAVYDDSDRIRHSPAGRDDGDPPPSIGRYNDSDDDSDMEGWRKKDLPSLPRFGKRMSSEQERGGARSRSHRRYPLLFTDPKRVLKARLFCLRQNRRMHPWIRMALLVFLAGSVCFTTFQLLFGSRASDGSHSKSTGATGASQDPQGGGTEKSFDYSEQELRLRKLLGRQQPQARVQSVFDVEAQNYSVHQWALETRDIFNTKSAITVAEDFMLSKAFSGVMQPTKIIPFYFRASFRDEYDDDDIHADEEEEIGQQDRDAYGFINNHARQHQQQQQQDRRNEAPPMADLDPSLVTITTLITPDRYGVFLKLVKQYRGPISVATHIRRQREGDVVSSTEKGKVDDNGHEKDGLWMSDQDRQFQELNRFFSENPILRKYVDLHVIVDAVDFQLNMWRNVGRMFARTDYFMMLDVDFHIPSGLKAHLHDDPKIQDLLASGAALVIPAFEYKADKDPKDSKYFPDTKEGLIPLLEKGHVRVFHDSFPPGHAATDTPRWMKLGKVKPPKRPKPAVVAAAAAAMGLEARADAPPPPPPPPPRGRVGFEESYDKNLYRPDGEAGLGQAEGEDEEEEERPQTAEELEREAREPYKVTAFEPKYEPYIVLKREGTPWCDERFVGYGANKAACLFEIYISGIEFHVMPEDFLIHQYHDYPTSNRKAGRILNKQLFVQFQQEVCFQQLRVFIRTGEWYTFKADQLREQCRLFEGFLKSADQLAKEFEEKFPGSLRREKVFVPLRKEGEDRHGGRMYQSPFGAGGEVEEEKMLDRMRDDEEEDDQDEDRRGGDDDEEREDGGAGEEVRWRYDHQRVRTGHSGGGIDEEEEDRQRSAVRESEWIVQQQQLLHGNKGQVWGGIVPQTYYVPPPPQTEDEFGNPIIDPESVHPGLGGVVNVGGDEGGGARDLSGERLERFRAGAVVEGGGVGSHGGSGEMEEKDRFAFPKEGESDETVMELVKQRQDQLLGHRPVPVVEGDSGESVDHRPAEELHEDDDDKEELQHELEQQERGRGRDVDVDGGRREGGEDEGFEGLGERIQFGEARRAKGGA